MNQLFINKISFGGNMISEKILQQKFDAILNEIRDLIKDGKIDEREITVLTFKNKKLRVSPYRICLEYRFPLEN